MIEQRAPSEREDSAQLAQKGHFAPEYRLCRLPQRGSQARELVSQTNEVLGTLPIVETIVAGEILPASVQDLRQKLQRRFILRQLVAWSFPHSRSAPSQAQEDSHPVFHCDQGGRGRRAPLSHETLFGD